METVEKLKTYMINLGYTQNTINMVVRAVKEFLNYTATELQNIGTGQINDYYEYLQTRRHKYKKQPLSEVYIAHQVYSLKLFFNWLEETKQISENPISTMEFKRAKANARQPLTQKEIKALFNVVHSYKEKAVLHLFYSCGLRRSEAEALSTSDIHFAQNILYVREGKGKKRRAIPITDKVKQDLEKYYNRYRKNQYSKDKEAFILNTKKDRMKGVSYANILHELLERARINKGATLHHLRHSIATHLLENNMSVEYVRDFLGHNSLQTTEIYTKVKQQQLNQIHHGINTLLEK
jgi:integrase/recombinase XerD